MDPQLLNHLLQLAAKTGDRLIVVDPNSQRPFVLMGIAQYEALLPHADARSALSPALGGGGARPGRSVGGWGADERGSEPTLSMGPAIAPGLDAVAQRANAELAAWRAQQPVAAMLVSTPDASVGAGEVSGDQSETVGGFSPEPLQPVSPDEDRFYVEPLE